MNRIKLISYIVGTLNTSIIMVKLLLLLMVRDRELSLVFVNIVLVNVVCELLYDGNFKILDSVPNN